MGNENGYDPGLRLLDKGGVAGIFRLRIYRSGILVEEWEDRNLIVDDAKGQMARLVAGDAAGRHISKIAFGTNGNSPNPFDDAITNQFARPVSAFHCESDRVMFDWELPVAEGNGMAIREFGLLTEDGKLFARKTRNNPIQKAPDISLEGQWAILF